MACGPRTSRRLPGGVEGFLDDLRVSVKDGSFRPLPVRQRMIPKPVGSGKLRSLGIPTVTDRVVQAALKLVLEPIFEADFLSVSYGFRPNRRAHDAVAEIHCFGTFGYHWVLDADIEACFDRIDHSALMDRVRPRVKDKRVLGLVKAFLKAGILTELGEHQDTHTGTPQGGILSPLLANIALSVLDEHVHGPWRPGGAMSTTISARSVAARVCRTGGSSGTPTISPCWSTAAETTRWLCTRRSAGYWPLWGCRFSRIEDPGGAPGRRVRLLGVPHPVAPQTRDRTSGSSTRSSLTGPSGR